MKPLRGGRGGRGAPAGRLGVAEPPPLTFAPEPAPPADSEESLSPTLSADPARADPEPADPESADPESADPAPDPLAVSFPPNGSWSAAEPPPMPLPNVPDVDS
ncbi:MAG: hypothetical protein J2P58_14600 [Acidimicrobiaceae bacterium]|nr:hypothetical protein [Acidimicrobiaceae bacterium]